MDYRAAPTVTQFVPSKQAERNFDANFWVGFRIVGIVGFLLFALACVLIGTMLHVNLFGIAMSTKTASSSQNALGYSIICCMLLVYVAIAAFYIRRQGGVSSVGGDMVQTGDAFNNDLFNENEARRQKELVMERAAVQEQARERTHQAELERIRQSDTTRT
jgi:hypothetical protein